MSTDLLMVEEVTTVRPLLVRVTNFAVTSRQLLPFQKPDWPVPFVVFVGPTRPTATQSVAVGQVTALNTLAAPVRGAGTLAAVQAFPFQVTA